ncbi:sugar-binding transcriptional regulator [Lentibacillus jeotgali]|uniref:sugar-binding transcriptional regulator n=1 Tax=Lentibacillus jeotgali TaxID=558169 RepID=UPI0002626882|nr:sugar-binding transcriptional regulator [Lentibacillus jeotgali]
MSFLDDRRLMVKIAHMYYEEGTTQSEIAKTIGISRSLVSKYLTKSRELGIVEIIIHDEGSHPFTGLESKVEQKYGLREVVCVPHSENGNSKSQLGAAASKYLLRMVRDGQIIGVSSGTTLYEVAAAMSSSQYFPDLSFVSLVGGMGDRRLDIHANQIVAQFAESLQAKYRLLHAPVLVDSKEAKEVIINQSSIKNVLDIANQANTAIVGIGGTPEHSTMVKSYLGRELDSNFEDEGIVGDICYNFIDENGEPVDNEWNEKSISLTLNQLKHIPLVIGVASGKEKVKAIRAALRGNLIHVLITDDATAKELLD